MRPLYVDLDGTFIKSDTLYECFILAVKENPLNVFKCILWFIGGKLKLKNNLAHLIDLNISALPLNEDFHDFLKSQRKQGRKVILATASARKYAIEFCDKYDVFDDFISSDSNTNLKSSEKLNRILSVSEDFAYAGNHTDDFPIFSKANETYLVNPSKTTLKKSKKFTFDKIFVDSISPLNVWVKQLRLYQWLKNLLIFVPLLVSGKYLEFDSVFICFFGFICFSLLASSTYIFNDLLDLESDRFHKKKRYRPLASADISIKNGILVATVFFVTSLAGTYLINDDGFTIIIFSYLFLTLAYSLKIKQHFGLDVIFLSILYTVRILAGISLLDLYISFWLLSFSMFIFFSLALVKRAAELKNLENSQNISLKGRDYRADDYMVILNFGASSSVMALLMFCFYTNNNILQNQYQEPELLWLAVPALGYWLLRMWAKTSRGEMHDDPIIFSLKDSVSLITIMFVIIITMSSQLT